MTQINEKWVNGAVDVIVDVFKSFRPELMLAFGNVAYETKADNTVVTDLDKKVETVLRKRLLDYDDSIGLLGEELGAEGDTGTMWLIDPIDGTDQFVRGIPTCRNMVTLIRESRPVMTVVYRFPTDDMFIAIEGKGTTKNGEVISVSNRDFAHTQVEFSSSFDNSVCGEIMNLFHRKAGGHSCHDWLMVVEGLRDAHCVFLGGGGDWDYAPRLLLLQETGAKVANIGPGPSSETWDYRNHSFLAANPEVFEDLLDAVQELVTKT